MFDQTFVDDARKAKEPVALAVSVLLQLIVLGLLALIPLIYTQGLPTAQLKNLLTAPPLLTAAPKSPLAAQPRHILVARRFPLLVAPTVIPRQINPNVDELRSVPAPDVAIPQGGVTQASAVDGLLPGALSSAPQPPPPVTPVQKSNPPSGPVRIGGAVAEANLIRKVMPVYPPLAKSARVQGIVEFSAIISKTGDIKNLRLVHGHPLLVQAAKDAVLQWKYRPTLLNGQSVEVVTDIVVNFTLSQ